MAAPARPVLPVKFKIKCRPEDFQVDELSTLPVQATGEHAVYRLEKRGWNTVDALRRIAKLLALPISALAYGGKKDRHGLTRQLITIQDVRRHTVVEDNFKLEFLGYAARPMGPHFLLGNRFAIVVRDVEPAAVPAALSALAQVQRHGCPNYFDDQRFGGYDARQGFLGEKLLKRHWNGALKAFLLSIHPEDAKEEKARKRALAEVWPDWKACRRMAVTDFEKMIFAHLAAHPGNFAPLLPRLPREEVRMAVSAYQSFLWNELVRRRLAGLGIDLPLHYPGAVGSYLFYRELPSGAASLPAETLPMLGARVELPDRNAEKLYRDLLAENGILPHLLIRIKIRDAAFRSVARPVLCKPAALKTSAAPDDLYPGRSKIGLEFDLGRGSYATLVIKRSFAQLV